ncbi:MAG: ferredoxin-NADP reductase [Planctomycetes bacterium]|nr:ferredoxin-NADP reductase [Planctomycetota bacterium]
MRLQDYDTSTRVTAQVVSSTRISPATTDEVREIVLDVDDPEFAPMAGQTVGLLAPGQKEFGQQHHFRLYTVADRPQVAAGKSRIVLCVRRCNYIDEYSGERFQGVASNYLCDLQPGGRITLTGPYGFAFEVPHESDATLILIGMGTGIAPFRAFVRHLHEDHPEFRGKIVLLHGGQTGMDLLYENDERNDFRLYYDKPTFEAIRALSANPVWEADIDWQTPLQKRADEIWQMLQQPNTRVYLAGLEKIRDQLHQVFAQIAGTDSRWQRRHAELVAGGRWVELLY